MSLLSIESVTHRYRRGHREYLALADVSMSVERGELVAVLGTRKSGKSTLLRVAAGLERPDQGQVRLDGVQLADHGELVGRAIAYCRSERASFWALEGELAIDHVASGLLAQGASPREAARAAMQVLGRLGAGHCAQMAPGELDAAECVRVGLARALIGQPRLLVIDEPTAGVGLLEGEPLIRLLHTIANEGTAVLMSTGESHCVSGASRVYALDEGELRAIAEAPQAEVVPFRREHARAAPLGAVRSSEHP